jgi:hypothetical protein
MSKVLLPLFIATAPLLTASTVIWTASGTVTSASGVYAADGITANTPVSVEMKYDDQAGRDVPRDLSGLGIPIKDLDYLNAIKLSISITIEDVLWHGQVETGSSGSPYTLFLKLNGTDGGSESLTATVQESDGATFDLFPLESGPENKLIQLLFSSSDNNFLTDEISASAIQDALITAASGSFQSGPSNKVLFSLDPTTVSVFNESLIPATPVISLLKTNDNLALSWESELGVHYRLQSSLTLEEDSWADAAPIIFGNGGTKTQNVAIAQGFAVYYRVLAFPAPEL